MSAVFYCSHCWVCRLWKYFFKHALECAGRGASRQDHFCKTNIFIQVEILPVAWISHCRKEIVQTQHPKEEVIMLFDNRTVYLGASRDKYEQYCKALDSEKIKYKTKRLNHDEKMIAPGRGTARSMGGNFGTDKTLYEILVGEKDYDNAMGILTALK